jgi:hypothetical protein
MSFKKFISSSLVCLAYLSSPGVSANDSSFGDDNGTITLKYQPDISMDKESLFISEENIQVDYVFTNTSQQELDIPVAFPMPPIYFGMSDHNEIENFKLWVNGKPQKTEHKLVVMLDDKVDISDKMADLGWSPDDVASFIESEAVPQGKHPLPSDWFDKDNQPRFTMSNYFIWKQHFPVGKPVSIRHSYVPSVTTGVPQPASYIIESYEKDTCLDKGSQIAVKKRESEFGVSWANLRYILVTANNWQGSIKDFNLTIKKQNPTDMVSLCFEGDLIKTNESTFEFHQKNFRPKHDLNLLFVRKPQ